MITLMTEITNFSETLANTPIIRFGKLLFKELFQSYVTLTIISKLKHRILMNNKTAVCDLLRVHHIIVYTRNSL
jgi:hypothetical protein